MVTEGVNNDLSRAAGPAGSPRPSTARDRPTQWRGLKPVFHVVGSRVLTAVVLLLVVSVLSFVLVSLVPGDAARGLLGPDATSEQYLRLRHAMGLDLPVPVQYWHWLTGAVRGQFGVSLIIGQPVVTLLASRIGVTLSLMAGSLLVLLIVGVSLGIASAVQGGAVGRFVDASALVGFAL